MKFLETRGLCFTKYIPNFTTVAKVWLNYSIVYGNECFLINIFFNAFESVYSR